MPDFSTSAPPYTPSARKQMNNVIFYEIFHSPFIKRTWNVPGHISGLNFINMQCPSRHLTSTACASIYNASLWIIHGSWILSSPEKPWALKHFAVISKHWRLLHKIPDTRQHLQPIPFRHGLSKRASLQRQDLQTDMRLFNLISPLIALHLVKKLTKTGKGNYVQT